MFRFDTLGIVAIWAAVVSGVIEEVLFRHRLNGAGRSAMTQIPVSGVLFGAAHALWALMARDWRIIVPAVASTTALGMALAVRCIAADRSTLPAVAAHTAVNLVIEPGLILTACLAGITSREPEAVHGDAS